MPLQTTVIGSFPKPDYVKLPDMFKNAAAGSSDMGVSTKAYTEMVSQQSDEENAKLDACLVRASKEIMDFQVACGVQVVTDGEVRRDNYVHYLCRFIEGIDFVDLTTVTYRNGAVTAALPTVRGKVSWRGPLDVVEEWRKAKDVAGSQPVKYTLPGPFTIIGTVHNVYYENEAELAKDLAVIVNGHVRALAAAGCRHIQIDEPVFARQPQKALDWGIKLLDTCFEGIDASQCERSMHMCCGYPAYLDQEGYQKADPKAYFQLAEAIDASCVDAVSIEDAHCHNDLSLLKLFKRTKVILGAVKIASSKVETAEEIAERLNEALQYIDEDRLIVAPDCGLAYLTLPLIKEKLTNMCKAAYSCGCKRAPVAGGA